MIIIILLLLIVIVKLCYDYLKNKYNEKTNVTVVNSKKEYEKIQKIIDDSLNKKENNDKLKEYIETIS
jgi:hypothetical protein